MRSELGIIEVLNKMNFYFIFKILFIYLREREHKQGEGIEGEADSPLSREPDVGLPGPWDHDLS